MIITFIINDWSDLTLKWGSTFCTGLNFLKNSWKKVTIKKGVYHSVNKRLSIKRPICAINMAALGFETRVNFDLSHRSNIINAPRFYSLSLLLSSEMVFIVIFLFCCRACIEEFSTSHHSSLLQLYIIRSFDFVVLALQWYQYQRFEHIHADKDKIKIPIMQSLLFLWSLAKLWSVYFSLSISECVSECKSGNLCMYAHIRVQFRSIHLFALSISKLDLLVNKHNGVHLKIARKYSKFAVYRILVWFELLK